MTKYTLHLDSRHRLSSTEIYQARFALVASVSNVHSVTVKNFQTANTIANVRLEVNDTVTGDDGMSGFGFSFAAGFQTAAAIVATIQANLAASFGAGTYAVLDTTTNEIVWTLPVGATINRSSSAGQILGLGKGTGTLSGNFRTRLFLAPMNIAFACPQLQHTLSLHTTPANQNAFLTVPVNCGYLEMLYYEPLNKERLEYGSSGIVLSTLDFEAFDPVSGLPLTEMSHWAMELEIECN